MGIYGFLGTSWVLITYNICPPGIAPDNSELISSIQPTNKFNSHRRMASTIKYFSNKSVVACQGLRAPSARVGAIPILNRGTRLPLIPHKSIEVSRGQKSPETRLDYLVHSKYRTPGLDRCWGVGATPIFHQRVQATRIRVAPHLHPNSLFFFSFFFFGAALFTGGRSNRDPRYTLKPTYIPTFTQHIWS